jgi:hypothetical protein
MTHPENSIYKLYTSGRISINPFDHEPIKDIYYPLHLDGTLYAYKKDLALPWIPVNKTKPCSGFDWYNNKLDMFKDALKKITTICDLNTNIDGIKPEVIKIPDNGLMLRPDVVYFGKTYEKVGFSNVSAVLTQSVSARALHWINVREDKIPVGFGWDYNLDCATNSPDSKLNICFQVFNQTVITPGTNICLFKIVKEKPITDCNTEKPRRIWKLDDQHSR